MKKINKVSYNLSWTLRFIKKKKLSWTISILITIIFFHGNKKKKILWIIQDIII
jgi:hypothetical protein